MSEFKIVRLRDWGHRGEACIPVPGLVVLALFLKKHTTLIGRCDSEELSMWGVGRGPIDINYGLFVQRRNKESGNYILSRLHAALRRKSPF